MTIPNHFPNGFALHPLLPGCSFRCRHEPWNVGNEADLLMKLIPRFNMQSAKQVEVHFVHSDPSTKEGDTDRFNRVLALWLDLQNAIQARPAHVNREQGCTPWKCPDQRVRDNWENFTHPRNALALEEFFYQLSDRSQLELASKALQVCRERRKEK